MSNGNGPSGRAAHSPKISIWISIMTTHPVQVVPESFIPYSVIDKGDVSVNDKGYEFLPLIYE